MLTLVTVLHLLACTFLILVVLLQTGKGAEMGAVFGGGGSETIFGAQGAGNLLTKLTTGIAVLFFVTSLTLAGSALVDTQESVFDDLAAPPPLEQPAAPEGPPPLEEPAAAGSAPAGPADAESSTDSTGPATAGEEGPEATN